MSQSARSAPDSLLLEAVDRALDGDWQAAHRIVQDHEADPVAAWIHAVVHRMDGDLANARYWYGRCRRELRAEVPTSAELREIRAEILAAAPPTGKEPREP